MNKPVLIAVGGLSGSGKTSLAKALAVFLPNSIHLDSDRTRKEVFGVTETMRLPPDAYTEASTQRVIAEMVRRTKEGLAAGKNVAVSALFLEAESRAAEEDLAKACGAAFAGIWLETEMTVLFERVARRANDASDATVAVVEQQIARGSGVISWEIIDSSAPLEEVLRATLKSVSVAKRESAK